MEPELKEKTLVVAKIAYSLETRRKNLDWFDYQVRGNRWDSKSSEEVKKERQEIIDDIAKLEKEYKESYGELKSVLPSGE